MLLITDDAGGEFFAGPSGTLLAIVIVFRYLANNRCHVKRITYALYGEAGIRQTEDRE